MVSNIILAGLYCAQINKPGKAKSSKVASAASSGDDGSVTDTITPTSLNPPLKWAGGKRWLVPHLLPHWEKDPERRLVEPFCGGLAVALGLMPKRALLNDANPHLINFYAWLKRGLRISIEMRYHEALFYRHRTRFNELLRASKHETREAASLFYYLNRTA